MYSSGTSKIDRRNLGAVCWSSDGKCLYAGGKYISGLTTYICKWDDEGRGKIMFIPAAESTIMNIRSFKKSGIVYCSAQLSFGIIDTNDKKLIYKKAFNADYADKGKITINMLDLYLS